jgi:hypothetical protein
MAPAKRRAAAASQRQRPRARKQKRHDAEALRVKFYAGDLSTRAFAEAEGVPYATLRKIAERYGWDAGRKAFRAEAARRSLDAVIDRRIEAEAEIDGIAHEAAAKLMRKLHLLVDNVTSAGTAKDAAKALTDLHQLARITAHLPAAPVADPQASPDGEIVMRRRGPGRRARGGDHCWHPRSARERSWTSRTYGRRRRSGGSCRTGRAA